MFMEFIVTLQEFRGPPPRFSGMRSQSLDHFLKLSNFLMVFLAFCCAKIVALAYLDSGKVKVEGIVNKTFTIDQWEECLESMRNKTAIKV